MSAGRLTEQRTGLLDGAIDERSQAGNAHFEYQRHSFQTKVSDAFRGFGTTIYLPWAEPRQFQLYGDPVGRHALPLPHCAEAGAVDEEHARRQAG